jgi:hypothetical protein
MIARMKATERLSGWYQGWNQAKYLSRFERWLNRSLWALLAIALVYALLQRVVLANVSEVFRGGARLGMLRYDIAIAYTGAFTFYLLNIRLPLRRDRRDIYRHIGPVARVVAQATGLMQMLNKAAGFDADRECTLANVKEVCAKITPQTPADLFVLKDVNPISATVMDAISFYATRARQLNRELLNLSTYLASDLIDLIAVIEEHGGLDKLELIDVAYQRCHFSKSENLSGIAPVLFNYLQIVDRVAKYRKGLRLTFYREPSYLLASGDDESDATPLKDEMDRWPVVKA